MNVYGHDNPGQSLQASDLANIQVNNDFQDDNEDDLDEQRLDQELKEKLDEVFNESEANMSVISSSHCSDASVDDIESNTSHTQSIHKSKKRAPQLSNPAFERLRNVNQNFLPEFHKDGSYPSPIPQYNPQHKNDAAIDAAQSISKQYVYKGMSNEVNYETLQALYELRRNEVIRLEKELLECKMHSEAEIDDLRKKMLINDSEYQRTVMEYQHQCENFKDRINHLDSDNLILRKNLEITEEANIKLTKEQDNNRINMKILQEQLNNLSRSNGSKQFDASVDLLVNDLKKKHSQELAYLQEQYKITLDEIKSKDHHCMLLTNELKKLQQEHQNIMKENNNDISKLTQELHDAQKNKVSNSKNDNVDILNLKNQLTEYSKEIQFLNDTLQKFKTENEQLRIHISASHGSNDIHYTNNASKLEDEYQNSLELLQKQRDDVKKLTEILSAKDRSIAEMEKKEITYKHCMHKIQEELEKYSHAKSHIGENSNHNCETLRNALEMLLEDTMCKLIRTEEDMSTLPIEVAEKDKLTNKNSIDEYMYYHQSSLENVVKQKDDEIEKLRNRMEEHVKEIDELKQLYVKVCSEKEQSLNEKEKLEKRFDELSTHLEKLNKQYGTVVKEKEELAITLISMRKEMAANQDISHKQLLEKENEELKNEIKIQKRQNEMITQLKVDLVQTRERVLTTEQRLKSEYDSKIATYVDQLDKLKKQYIEKVDELNQAKDNNLKLTNSDSQTSTKLVDNEKILRSKLSDYENLLANIERKHKLSVNELTYKYKNELHELEMIYNKKLNEEKITCAKTIEELKSKHRIEIETFNTVAKQNAADYVSQELIQIVADHKKQCEKAKDLITSKNNTIKELEMQLENTKMEISIKNSKLEQLIELQANWSNVDKLKEQIEEERSKFAHIMTNWSQEMQQIKEKLSTSLAEREKLQTKYAKLKHAALNYKHINQKQQFIYNDLLASFTKFFDELKTKTDLIFSHKENEIQQALNEFENECKQRRLAFNNIK